MASTALTATGRYRQGGRKGRKKLTLVESFRTQPAQKVPVKKQEAVVPQTRNQQLDEIYTEEDFQRIQNREKMITRSLNMAGASLGLSTLGSIAYAPLTLVSIPLFLAASFPVHKSSFDQLREGKIGVDMLTTLTLAGCLATGYVWIGTFATFVMIGSRKMLLRVTADSRDKLVNVFRQHPKNVWIIRDGVELEIPFEEVEVGQTVVVGAGEAIPVDGVVKEGMANVDQHILTGESKPQEKEVGDTVFALTTVLSGRIYIEVEKAGNETTVAQIGDMLNQTVEFKAGAELRAETWSNKTAVPTLIVSAATVPFLGPMSGLAMLNAHFKHKMSVVSPLSLMNFLNMASQRGILVKDGRSLELLNQIDTVVFDKTGTLTQEQPYVGAVHAASGFDEQTLLTYAAAAEEKQSHPIAKAIIEEAVKRGIEIPSVEETEYKMGYGLTVSIDGHLVRVGSIRFMELCELEISAEMRTVQDQCHAYGHSLVMVAIDDQVAGGVELLPTIRPEAKQVIDDLREKHGITSTYIISGDHEAPTRKMAEELGIDHYFAETLPEDKANLIQGLIDEGKFVCYVGDGINDSIALKKSHVSISLRGASSIAVDTAQIILMDEKLSHLSDLFTYAHKFHTNVNAAFALVTVPMLIGMGGVLFLGFGLAQTIVVNLISLGAGVTNSMIPLLTARIKDDEE